MKKNVDTIQEVQNKVLKDEANCWIYIMDFVDDFRFYKDLDMVRSGIDHTGSRWDALLASLVETLCDKLKTQPPDWTYAIESLPVPWFVSGVEKLKAIALVESPLRFRVRQIFVFENFLVRV